MLTFLYPILTAVNHGPFIRKVVVLCLKAFAVIAALVGVIAVIGVLKLSFNAAVPTSVTVGGLLLAGALLAGTACIVQILLYRAAQIVQLTEEEYLVIPIASRLIRMVGELLATITVAFGVGGFALALLAGSAASQYGEMVPGPFSIFLRGTSGFAGFFLLIVALVIAFNFLIGFYFSSEMLQVVVDVAGNVRHLAGGRGPAPTSQSDLAGVPPQPFSRASMKDPVKCPHCGTLAMSGNAFCVDCGAAVGTAVGV